MKLLTVYVHGIGDHISAEKVKVDWDSAIFSKEMDYRTRTAFWSDIRYPRTLESKRALAALAKPEMWEVSDTNSFIDITADDSMIDKDRRDFIMRLAARMCAVDSLEAESGSYRAKLLPLPQFLRDPITRAVTSLLIKDVAAYFYDENQRKQIRERLIECLNTTHDNFILVTHSMGTVIAYDVLSSFSEPHRGNSISVPLWVTIGSPLGIKEVQDRLGVLRNMEKLQKPRVVQEWHNYADPFDAVAIDPTVADDYNDPGQRFIHDYQVSNPDRLDFTQYGPHSGTGYLSLDEVRERITTAACKIAGADYLSSLTDFIVPKDVAHMLNRTPTQRIPVLIELDERAAGATLDEKRKSVVKFLEKTVVEKDKACIDEMARFVSARLTAAEIDELAHRSSVESDSIHRKLRESSAKEIHETSISARQKTESKKLTVSRIWHNSSKRTLVNEASKTIHGTVARLGYTSTGRGITWAVLDSGAAVDHPHFKMHENITRYYDCTSKGISEISLSSRRSQAIDKNGHGTHVCGIIAGEGKERDGTIFVGIAPEAELHVYKVLKDNGSGDDSYIIKALDHIADLNEKSNKLVVHGINLSLGGPFDSTVFACGHSPLCRELKRLWRKGVVIVVAAGNEGEMRVLSPNGVLQLNNDVTISDPANLEDCIAVGSVHKSNPHFFGPSFFSSRGPTSDGRQKPDCIAPGERILSCNNGYAEAGASRYVEMSGTSMAAPVVSGLLASFLSVRNEFIGRPDELKELLLSNCTDLKRDRYFQGSGMPNLVKMIMNT